MFSFISHMVQIILEGHSTNFPSDKNDFISHMVQIIQGFAVETTLEQHLYIPHGSDNT